MMSKFGKVMAVLGLVVLLGLGANLAVSAQGGGVLGRPFRPRAGAQESIAETLGMTIDALRDALRYGKSLADLAEEKGVELEDLKDAADAARDEAVRERIAQAVENGNLSQERADWMLQGLDSGYGLGGRFSGGVFGRFGSHIGADRPGLEAAAQALGMTDDELSLQLWAGESLADVAEAQGVALEDVQSAIEEARQAAVRDAIQQAVENGNLTQEQADWMLEGLEEGYMQRGPELGGAFGHGIGRLGFRRGGPRGEGGLWGDGEETDAGNGARFFAPRASFGQSL